MEIVINANESGELNSQWGLTFLDNEIRTFLFKLHNNTLSYNYLLAKFVRGKSPLCTFCTLSRNEEDHDERPLHLFFQCRHTEPVILGVYAWVLNNEQEFDRMSRKNFFVGFEYDNSAKNRTLALVGIFVKKYIWECKTRYTLPSLDVCKRRIQAEMNFLVDTKEKIATMVARSGVVLRR